MNEIYPTAILGLWLILSTIIVQAMVAIRVHRAQKKYNVGVIDPSLGQSSIVFRAHRTFQNSIENIIPFFGLVILAMFANYGAEGKLANIVWVYAIARIIHMVLYYAIATNKNPSIRSIFWAAGFLVTVYLMVDLGVFLIKD